MKTLCPSARCAEGSLLIGVINSDGHVDFTGEAMPINQNFVVIAHQGRPPEKRFRFASACVQKACCQWSNGRCGVADMVVELQNTKKVKRLLPTCSIRNDCRWFEQRGAAACHACPTVITDLMVDSEVRR